MKEKQLLVIILPEHLEELPVQIIRGAGYENLVLSVEQENNVSFSITNKRQYAFIWQQSDYLKVALDDILWIEAAGSYSVFHMAGSKSLMIAFHLAVVEKKLPQADFIRIHRSYIVNLRHVLSLVGNSLKIDDRLLVIGREYRTKLSDRFIFLGVRKNKTP